MAKVTRLRKLKITRVALCRQGLDPSANILIYKSADGQASGEPPPGPDPSSEGEPDTPKNLRAAIRAFHQAGKDASKNQRSLIKRARALGRPELIPEGWMAKSKDTTKDEELDLDSLDLEDDVREQLQKMLDDRAAEAATAVDTATKAEAKVAKLQKTVKTLAADDPKEQEAEAEEEVFKGLSPEVVERIKKAEERAKASEETVAKLLTDSRQNTFVAKARAELPRLTEHDELGKALEVIEGRNPEEYKVVERVLKAANAAIDSGKVFSEIGGAGDTSHLGDTAQKVAKMADEVMKAEPKLTRAQAEARVITQHPELYTDASPGHYFTS